VVVGLLVGGVSQCLWRQEQAGRGPAEPGGTPLDRRPGGWACWGYAPTKRMLHNPLMSL